MPNQKSPQIGFEWQSPPINTYRVGPGLLFTTIQAAINQMQTDAPASAVLEIYNDGFSYVENVVINLDSLNNLRIIGNGSFLVGQLNINSSVLSDRTFIIEDMNIFATLGNVGILMSGSPGNINSAFSKITLVKADDDGVASILMDWPGFHRFNNCFFFRTNDSSVGGVIKHENGTLIFTSSEFNNAGSPLAGAGAVYFSPTANPAPPPGDFPSNQAEFYSCKFFFSSSEIFKINQDTGVQTKYCQFIYDNGTGTIFGYRAAAANSTVVSQFNFFYRTTLVGAGYIATSPGGGRFFYGYNDYFQGNDIQNTITLVTQEVPLNPIP